MAMKIYTRTGDGGETSLFGGRRVAKDDLRIEACGTVDELNSFLGICRSFNTVREVDGMLSSIQSDLFKLGADLASPRPARSGKVRRIGTRETRKLEHQIDRIELQLPRLKNFILPGGGRSAAMLHYARTVCRRAERRVVALSRSEPTGIHPIIYLNRLADFLFVLARWVNSLSNTEETIWKGS